jgi:hypothetical protein
MVSSDKPGVAISANEAAPWLLMGQPGVTETRSIAEALQRAGPLLGARQGLSDRPRTGACDRESLSRYSRGVGLSRWGQPGAADVTGPRELIHEICTVL